MINPTSGNRYELLCDHCGKRFATDKGVKYFKYASVANDISLLYGWAGLYVMKERNVCPECVRAHPEIVISMAPVSENK